MIIYSFVAATILLLLHILHRYSRHGRMLDKIPGPTAYPFIGNMLYFNGSAEHLWYAMHALIADYPRIARIWLGMKTVVQIQHPDDIQTLLMSKKDVDKGSFMTEATIFIGDGLLFSSGEKNRRRRKMVLSSFNKNYLKDYIEVTSEYGESFIKHLKSFGDEASHCLTVLWPDLLLRLSCEIIVGCNAKQMGIENINSLNDSVEYMINFQVYRASHPYITNWLLPLFKKYRELKRQAKIFNNFTYKMYDQRKEYNQQINKRNTKTSNSIDIKENLEVQEKSIERQTALDNFLSFEEEGLLDAHGVKEELNVLIIAVYDTTLSASTFTTMVFAENMDAQDRAREEVTEILDRTGGKISITELQQFKYLERCIKESLRMYPPVPMLNRYLKKDLQLKTHVVPAGTETLLMIYAMHRDPEFWSEPEKFDPDRFLPENVKARHPYAYFPFSTGPRSCPGSNLALMQLKCLFAGILYNFRLEPVDRIADQRFRTSLTLHLTKPVHTKFVKINR